jgi:nitrate/nitrite transport system permease protein
MLGLGLLVLVWALVSPAHQQHPQSRWRPSNRRWSVFSDPFYSKGPNDQGVGWNV